ncbi:conserved hypothetical protein [Coccidioides posadasii str. Silveira]|uniref:Uncharacterized protein n=2 Tax=Coccidioides posadasii TaxID=199306 RepID=E9CX21_COCPS|nr:conserved hypothetical protein [Coccidioides posadasii str. Silveira]KMM65305.1 hypothetical protein CPAG_01656 [Coccidioides posadasii RMSCC 3488]
MTAGKTTRIEAAVACSLCFPRPCFSLFPLEETGGREGDGFPRDGNRCKITVRRPSNLAGWTGLEPPVEERRKREKEEIHHGTEHERDDDLADDPPSAPTPYIPKRKEQRRPLRVLTEKRLSTKPYPVKPTQAETLIRAVFVRYDTLTAPSRLAFRSFAS